MDFINFIIQTLSQAIASSGAEGMTVLMSLIMASLLLFFRYPVCKAVSHFALHNDSIYEMYYADVDVCSVIEYGREGIV